MLSTTVFVIFFALTGDATLSRHKGINIKDLHLQIQIATTPSGVTWRGRWQKNDIVAKILSVRDCNARVSRDFNEEFPKLRYVRNFDLMQFRTPPYLD